MGELQKIKARRVLQKPYKTKIKINLYHHKNPGKLYRSSQNHRAAQKKLLDFFVYTI